MKSHKINNNRSFPGETTPQAGTLARNQYYSLRNIPFTKTLFAGVVCLAVNSFAYAQSPCDGLPPLSEASCVYADDVLSINIHTDINNPGNNPAYQFNSFNTYFQNTYPAKAVISLDKGKTIRSDATGIEAVGMDTPYTREIEVNVSGNIYTGKVTDIDEPDLQTPIDGPSGGFLNGAFVNKTQHASVYVNGASGGILGLGMVNQNTGSQIVNQSVSKDTAAIYSRALESRINTSGIVRALAGDAIRLQDTGPKYMNSGSGGYFIEDPVSVFDVHLKTESVVDGGSEGAGIHTIGGATSTITIDEGATLGALSDVAISATGYDYYSVSQKPVIQVTGATTNITNAGVINGIMQLTSGQDTIVNDITGVWNVRQWSDSDRDGIRDTSAPVATSDFGGGTTVLDNRGQIILTASPDGSANSALFQNLTTFKNQGRLLLINNVAGDRFTIDGDYAGNNGTIGVDIYLNDDSSLTDRLIINGSTSGQSYLTVNNLGGAGAQTRDGIKVVEVYGDSGGEFTLQGRVVGGAYEYYLHKNGLSTQDGNWYLRSQLPEEPTTPEQVNRPEPGSYMFNHMAANTLFLMRLHDRLGDAQYTDVLTGEKKVTSLWLRQIGGHNRSRDSSGQLKTQGNRYVIQIGGDVAQWSTDGLNRWHLGLMTGYARQDSNTESKYSGYRSRGAVEGYSAGFYGTWYANEKDKTGSYVDTWALYNWFDNEVKGDQLVTEKYKSRGVTASVEVGYTFKLGARASDGVKYFLQPKAQLTWMNVRAGDHTEHDSNGGSRVSFEGDGNLQSRLGLRAYISGHSTADKGKNREFQPFIEASWIHNSRDFGTKVNGDSNRIAGTRNIGEIKAGVEGQISRRLDLWGNAVQQVGGNGYSDTQVMLGVKYRF